MKTKNEWQVNDSIKIDKRLMGTSLLSNDAFKPKPLRSTKHMADKACHVFGSTTQFGLTQVLGIR